MYCNYGTTVGERFSHTECFLFKLNGAELVSYLGSHLADLPVASFHICNFDICHEILGSHF